MEILELKNTAFEINLLDVINSSLATSGKRINEPKDRILEVIQIESERRKKDWKEIYWPQWLGDGIKWSTICVTKVFEIVKGEWNRKNMWRNIGHDFSIYNQKVVHILGGAQQNQKI